MKNKFSHIFVVVCILLSLSATRAQECSNIFTVYRGFNRLYAEVLKANNYYEPVLRLDVTMSVNTPLESNFNGQISLTNRDVYNDLLQNRVLRYSITFPFYDPIPVATLITFNGRTICTGRPAQGYYPSTIRLYHTHTLNVAPPPNYAYPNQVEETTQGSILNSLVDLIAQPFTTPKPAQRIEPQTQPAYYSQPMYVQTPEAPHFVEPASTLPPTTARPVYYTQRTYKPTSQPTQGYTQSTTTFSPIPSIPDRFSDFRSQCGLPIREMNKSSGLIVNGNSARKGEFPWLAAFYYNGYGDDGFICGGSLISTKLVLTAAHCVQEKKSEKIRKAEEVFFYFGKYYLSSPITEKDVILSGVSQLIVHPDYDAQTEKYDADIAMAVLLRSITFTNFVRPICIWTQTQNHDDLINQKGIIAGWGKTESSVSASDKPFWAQQPVVDDITCLRSNSVFSKITSNRTFCAGSRDGKGPCNGDSGGGFVVKSGEKWYLRGIVSSSLIDTELYICDTKNYAVFTDVAQFKSWILEFIERYG